MDAGPLLFSKPGVLYPVLGYLTHHTLRPEDHDPGPPAGTWDGLPSLL